MGSHNARVVRLVLWLYCAFQQEYESETLFNRFPHQHRLGNLNHLGNQVSAYSCRVNKYTLWIPRRKCPRRGVLTKPYRSSRQCRRAQLALSPFQLCSASCYRCSTSRFLPTHRKPPLRLLKLIHHTFSNHYGAQLMVKETSSVLVSDKSAGSPHQILLKGCSTELWYAMLYPHLRDRV